MGGLNPGKLKRSITLTGIGDNSSNAENLEDMVRQISLASTSEIDRLTNDLTDLRKKLESRGRRIQNDIIEYAELSQSAVQLTKIVSDSVAQVERTSGAPSVNTELLFPTIPVPEKHT